MKYELFLCFFIISCIPVATYYPKEYNTRTFYDEKLICFPINENQLDFHNYKDIQIEFSKISNTSNFDSLNRAFAISILNNSHNIFVENVIDYSFINSLRTDLNIESNFDTVIKTIYGKSTKYNYPKKELLDKYSIKADKAVYIEKIYFISENDLSQSKIKYVIYDYKNHKIISANIAYCFLDTYINSLMWWTSSFSKMAKSILKNSPFYSSYFQKKTVEVYVECSKSLFSGFYASINDSTIDTSDIIVISGSTNKKKIIKKLQPIISELSYKFKDLALDIFIESENKKNELEKLLGSNKEIDYTGINGMVMLIIDPESGLNIYSNTIKSKEFNKLVQNSFKKDNDLLGKDFPINGRILIKINFTAAVPTKPYSNSNTLEFLEIPKPLKPEF